MKKFIFSLMLVAIACTPLDAGIVRGITGLPKKIPGVKTLGNVAGKGAGTVKNKLALLKNKLSKLTKKELVAATAALVISVASVIGLSITTSLVFKHLFYDKNKTAKNPENLEENPTGETGSGSKEENPEETGKKKKLKLEKKELKLEKDEDFYIADTNKELSDIVKNDLKNGLNNGSLKANKIKKSENFVFYLTTDKAQYLIVEANGNVTFTENLSEATQFTTKEPESVGEE